MLSLPYLYHHRAYLLYLYIHVHVHSLKKWGGHGLPGPLPSRLLYSGLQRSCMEVSDSATPMRQISMATITISSLLS